MEFEELSDLDQARALAAVLDAFTKDDCRTIQQWATVRSITPQEAWDEVLAGQDIPACRMPSRLSCQ
jgi:hypothetical protein